MKAFAYHVLLAHFPHQEQANVHHAQKVTIKMNQGKINVKNVLLVNIKIQKGNLFAKNVLLENSIITKDQLMKMLARYVNLEVFHLRERSLAPTVYTANIKIYLEKDNAFNVHQENIKIYQDKAYAKSVQQENLIIIQDKSANHHAKNALLDSFPQKAQFRVSNVKKDGIKIKQDKMNV